MMYSLLRRFVCLVLAAALCGACLPARAANDTVDPIERFTDVSAGAWYAEPIREAVNRGFFAGETASTFGPKHPLSRGMLVTVLWQMAGKPVVHDPIPFTDVKEKAYYAEAVRWAAAKGVVAGVSKTRFAPTKAITRQQMTVILMAFTAARGLSTEERTNLYVYPDRGSVSAYAQNSVSWAAARGMMVGSNVKGLLYLYPRRQITRAEAAAVLVRFYHLTFLGETPESGKPAEAQKPAGTRGLWVQGNHLSNGPVWNGITYCKLSELAAAGEGSLRVGANIRLGAWKHVLFLSRSNSSVLTGGSRSDMGGPCLYYKGEWYAPAAPLMALLGMDTLEDPEKKQTIYSYVPHNDAIPEGVPIVLLRYHCVSDDIWGSEPLFMSPSSLEEQIRTMRDMGCSFLTFEDLDKIDQYEKPVFLTFDDGYRDNYEELFPILKRYNVKATIFVITGGIGGSRFMDAGQLRELSESGLVSLQSHTVSHKDMRQMSDEQLEYQCAASQLALARITGKIPFAMSFPRAMANDAAYAQVARFYQYSVIKDGYKYVTGTDPYKIPRFVMPRSLTIERLLSYFE